MRCKPHTKSRSKIKLFINNDKRKSSNLKITRKIKIRIILNPVERSIIHYNFRNHGKEANVFTNIETIERITMNFIRHELTNYDKLLLSFDKTKDGMLELKQFVNKKILQKYENDFIEKEVNILKLFNKFGRQHE